jgi:hypothetical protein
MTNQIEITKKNHHRAVRFFWGLLIGATTVSLIREANVKLRVLAAQVAADFVAVSGGKELPPRSAYDNQLLTAHLRINADMESGDATVLPSSEKTG